jgi:hypothetical protein
MWIWLPWKSVPGVNRFESGSNFRFWTIFRPVRSDPEMFVNLTPESLIEHLRGHGRRSCHGLPVDGQGHHSVFVTGRDRLPGDKNVAVFHGHYGVADLIDSQINEDVIDLADLCAINIMNRKSNERADRVNGTVPRSRWIQDRAPCEGRGLRQRNAKRQHHADQGSRDCLSCHLCSPFLLLMFYSVLSPVGEKPTKKMINNFIIPIAGIHCRVTGATRWTSEGETFLLRELGRNIRGREIWCERTKPFPPEGSINKGPYCSSFTFSLDQILCSPFSSSTSMKSSG